MASNFTYKMTDLAITDIDDTIDYIVNVLKAGSSAKKLYNDIEKAIDNICKKPMLNHDCKYYGIDDENFRYIKIGNYLLFYYVNDIKKEIEILKFLYSKRNISVKEIK